MKYQARPLAVDAVQITDDWFDQPHPNPLHPIGLMINPRTRTAAVDTKEGVITARVGDWIIDFGRAGRKVCKPVIFHMVFELIPEGNS